MTIRDVVRPLDHFFKENAPAILTALGVSGTIGTAYLTAKASFEAARMLDAAEIMALDEFDTPMQGRRARVARDVKYVWKLYIPAAVSGTVTVVCIIGGARVGAKRTAAAYSLLTVSEKALVEYTDKVKEIHGEKKEQAVRDAVAQDRVAHNPPGGIVVVETGSVLCYEAHTGRYFNSTIEALRRAENKINAKVIREMEVPLAEFYHLIGLEQTSHSYGVGWYSDKILELRFSSVMSADERPCLSFEYNYIRPLYGMREE